MSALLLGAPLAPLLAALAIVLARRSAPALALLGCAAGLVCVLPLHGSDTTLGGTWLDVGGAGGVALDVGLAVDGLSWAAAVLVLTIALGVLLWTSGRRDRVREARLYAWLCVFVGAMVALVLARSLVLLFAAWELIGVASFALIAHHRAAAPAAARALVTTRAADLGLLLAWLLAAVAVGTTRLDALAEAARQGAAPAGTFAAIGGLALVAAVGKSAQLPLSAWLPGAMAAPTPVSALLHSATLVAAGVLLLLKLHPVLLAAPGVLEAALWVGAATAVAGALLATAERDLKRLLAWSTVSQLGEMMLALGLLGFAAAGERLFGHAFVKAGLFLAAGTVAHQARTRSIARLARGDPDDEPAPRHPHVLTAASFAVAAASLAALPPLLGWFGADVLLAVAEARGGPWAVLVVVLGGLIGAYVGSAAAAVVRWAWRAPGPAAARAERVALVLFAAVAAAGGALSGPLEQTLGLGPTGSPSVWLVVVAAVASLAGVGVGIARLPAPALGRWPLRIGAALEGLLSGSARAALAVARAVARTEAALDVAARRLAAAMERGASVAARVEALADRESRRFGAATSSAGEAAARAEALADRAARWSGAATLHAGAVAARAEEDRVARPVDRAAKAVSRAGGALRRLQPGRVYLYTLSLFVWVVVAGLAAALAA